jgi:uncharacterized repeat protein (TIGR02543 family)
MKQGMQIIRKWTVGSGWTGFVALLCLLLSVTAEAGIPALSNLRVTDVTPRSFSVIGTVSEPSTAVFSLYSSNCITPVTGFTTKLKQNTASGNMRLTVTGLAAATNYCYTLSITSLSTSQPITSAPAPVSTAAAVRRTKMSGPNLVPAGNDILRVPDVHLATGETRDAVIVMVELLDGSAVSPLSLILSSNPARDYFNLNNLFATTTGKSLDLAGGERVKISEIHGVNGSVIERYWTVPADGGETAARPFTPDASTTVNGACGAANGKIFSTAPVDNLCSTGTASTVTSLGPWSWNWTCDGSNGGTPVSCSAIPDNRRYPVSFIAGANGALSGTASQRVKYGAKSTTVTAVPADGYHFANWTGTGGFVTTASNPLTVTNVTSALTITANFTPFPVATITYKSLGLRTAVFNFTSGEGTTFKCRLDTEDYTDCTSPASYDGLVDGNHTFQVKAIDSAGYASVAPASSTWTVNATPPATIASPVGGMYNSTQLVSLTTSRPATIYYTINGDTPTISSTRYTGPVTISANTMLKYFAVDGALNEDVKTQIYTVDRTPPTLKVSTLPDMSTTTDAILNVTGTVTDDNGVKDTVMINGILSPTDADGSFSQAVSLAPGDTTITTIASDTAGNQTTDSRIITYDPAAPTLDITAPNDNSATALDSLNVTGSIGNGTTVKVQLNGSEPAVANLSNDGTGFSSSVSPLIDGLNTIIIVATRGDKTSVAKRTVFKKAFFLEIASPVQDAAVSHAVNTITGKFGQAPVQSVVMTINGTSVVPDPEISNGGFSKDITFAGEGNHQITVTANAGDTVSVTRNIIYRKGSIIINNGDLYTSSAMVNLSLSYPDKTDTTRMQFSTDGRTWSTLEPFATSKAINLPGKDGLKNITVRFTDDLATATFTTSIILDTTDPVNGAVIVNQTAADEMTFTWQGFSDATSGIGSYIIARSTTGIPTTCKSGALYEVKGTSYVDKGLTLPPYFYRLCAKDNAGNISTGLSISRQISDTQIDFTAPAGSIVINKPGELYTAIPKVTLTIHATDGINTSDKMCISNTPVCTSWVAYAPIRSWTLTNGDGLKTVYAYFRDKAGNSSTIPAIAGIILDSTAPANGTMTITPDSGNNLNLSWQGFSDATSGIANYIVVAGTKATPSCNADPLYSGPLTSFSHENLTLNTMYYYRVCAQDAAGNTSTGAMASKLVRSEYTPPAGTVIVNNEALYTNKTKVTLAIHADDHGGSGVDKMCISNLSSCTSWVPYATDKDWILSSGDGSKTVNIWFRDNNGNVNATPYQSNSIKLDTKAPKNGTLQISNTFNLTWSGFSDEPGGSGLKDYILVRSTIAAPACNTAAAINTSDATATLFDDHATASVVGKTYYYRVCARDNAGNISTGTTVSKKK